MTNGFKCFDAGWSSLVARQAHNLKVVGSNPTPATKKSNKISMLCMSLIFKFTCFSRAHCLHKIHILIVRCDMIKKQALRERSRFLNGKIIHCGSTPVIWLVKTGE